MSPLIAGVITAVGQVADDLFTSDEERLKAELEFSKIGLEAAKVDADLIKGQQEVNKVEAAHTSILVAGARPAVLWVGVVGLAYQFVLYPLMTWGWALLQSQGWIASTIKPPPILDIEALMVLMSGILGIATARTFEKVRGVSRESLK